MLLVSDACENGLVTPLMLVPVEVVTPEDVDQYIVYESAAGTLDHVRAINESPAAAATEDGASGE